MLNALAVALSLSAFYPSAPAAQAAPAQGGAMYSPEVLGWKGWGALSGEVPTVQLPDPNAPELPVPADAARWRTKVFVFTSMDLAQRSDDGIVRFRRAELLDPQMAVVQTALKRLPGAIARSTGGALKVEVETEIWKDTIRLGTVGNDQTAIAQQMADFLAPRFNGGVYEAEDRKFRGPYHNVIVITPMEVAESGFSVNRTPVVPVSFYRTDLFESLLEGAFMFGAGPRARAFGYEGNGLTPAGWRDIAGDKPDWMTLAERRRTGSAASPTSVMEATIRANSSRTYRAAVTTDADRGEVLSITEQGLGRYGLAYLRSIPSVPANRSLAFWAKSSSRDGFAVVAKSGFNFEIASLGRDPSGNVKSVPFRYDGTWQRVVVPLPAGENVEVTIQPTLHALRHGKVAIEPHTILVDGFELVEGAAPLMPAPVANAESVDVEERLLAAAQTTDPAVILKLLDDPRREVVATAMGRVTSEPTPELRARVIRAMSGIDAWVSILAVEKAATFAGDDIKGELLKTLKFAITDTARGAAARALAKNPDEKTPGEIMVLAAGRTPSVRYAAAEALTMIPTREAGIIRMAFIQQGDPFLKLIVTRSANPAEEYDMRKLLWSAVNETSDQVRLHSALKLIQSPVAEFRADGYKVIRDDSAFVRRTLAEYLGANPNPAHRSALLIAVVDPDENVRAAALNALAAQEAPVSAEEVQKTFADDAPEVMLALIRLMRAKGLEIPEETRRRMAECPDTRVRQALGGSD